MQTVQQLNDSSQAVQLSGSDRELLVRASLALIVRRLDSGFSVTDADLQRVMRYEAEPGLPMFGPLFGGPAQ